MEVMVVAAEAADRLAMEETEATAEAAGEAPVEETVETVEAMVEAAEAAADRPPTVEAPQEALAAEVALAVLAVQEVLLPMQTGALAITVSLGP